MSNQNFSIYEMYIAVLFGCNKVTPKIVACSKLEEELLKFCEVDEDDMIPFEGEKDSWVYNQFPQNKIDAGVVCYSPTFSFWDKNMKKSCSCFVGLAIVEVEKISTEQGALYDLNLSNWFINPNAMFFR